MKTGTKSRVGTALGQFLSVDEAAALLRVNRKTVYLAIQRNEFPGVCRLGARIRIVRDALLAWQQPSAAKPVNP